MQTTAMFIAALALTGPVPGQFTPSSSSPGQLTLSNCVVAVIADVDVPAPEPGVVMSLDVVEGQSVAIDSPLAQIDDRDARLKLQAAQLQLKAARVEADNDVNVRAAEAAQKVAQSEQDDAAYMNKLTPGAIPFSEVRRLRLTEQRSGLQKEVAIHELTVAKLTADVRQAEVSAAQNEIERRRVASPLEGIVEEIHKRPGEWATQGEPILRIVQMDRLRVTGFVKAKDHLPQEVKGQPVTVRLRLPGGRIAEFRGGIDFVSQSAEKNGSEFRVFAEIVNRKVAGEWLMRPEMNAEMQIETRPLSNADLDVDATAEDLPALHEADDPDQGVDN